MFLLVTKNFCIDILDYIISIFAIHNILFITFCALTIAKLTFKAKEALKTDDKQIIQNKAYLYIGICFIFSYLFFFLTLTLIPINSVFGILMLPMTVAYVVAYILILRRVVMILSTNIVNFIHILPRTA